MIIECNEINPYYVYRHRRLDTFEIFYVGISKVKSRCRKVIDVSTNIIYNTLKDVSILFNIKPSTLSHYLNNTRTNKTTFKYI